MKFLYIYNLAFDRQVIIRRQSSLPIRRQRSHVAYITWHSAVRSLFVGKALYRYVGNARMWPVGGSLPHTPL
jgi:hypothetical protein